MLLRTLILLLLLGSWVCAQRLAVIGDWGAASPHRPQVAQAMREAHEKHPFDGLITLGDNFYPRGEPVQAFIDDLPKVRIYPAFGNHDVPALGAQLRLFGVERPYYSFRLGALEVFVVYSEVFDPAQRSWLETALKTSRAPWKVLVLHRPLYSSGFHGGSRSLRSSLEPLLLRYEVRLVLAGHDHDYERLEARGITHVVSGGGGAYLRGFLKAVPQSRVRVVEAHFGVLEASEERLSFTAVAPGNKLLDSFTLRR
ncbi:metallophosphoesterase family protein [Calidithermus roseus]|uniref:Calcineurin-like phosphoesterase n=1 Tax=Calidithermus roseus TaxID=1644118 RepID=A0A399EW31_9DEIN|nr:metallophosphoesterase [Calidithermus roseus]RIH87646.1 Calcineurin-like phosphoesterase [Calidithermus roseus]